jgi:hypothetical protein
MISIAAWMAFTSPALAADVSIGVGDDISALTSSLRPGDRVLFAPGSYDLEGTITWTGLGTEAEPITIKPNGEGEVLFNNIGGSWGIRIVDSAFISVEGITVVGGEYGGYVTGSGIEIENSTDITLTSCIFKDLDGDGIRIDGDARNLLIEGNEVANLANGTGINVGCGDASCWLQDSLIAGNLIHDTRYSGIYLQPGTQNVEIIDNNIFRADRGAYLGPTELGPTNYFEGNAVWQTEGDGIHIEGTAIVRNNVVFETGGDGIYTNNNDRNGLVDVVISHNTVARTDGYAANLDDAYGSSGFVFANNALANPTGYGLDWDDEYKYYGVASTNYISNNVVTGLVQGFDPLLYPSFVVPGGGFSDFENADNFDFYPRQGSTVVDRGDAAGDAYIPEFDFNGIPREGNAPDVGAYEWDGAGNPGWVIQETFKETGATANSNRADLGGGCCGDGGSGDQGLLFLPLAGVAVALRRRRRRS